MTSAARGATVRPDVGNRKGSLIPTLTGHERQDIERANQSGLRPVVFVHGPWLLPSSCEPWRRLFEERGSAAYDRQKRNPRVTEITPIPGRGHSLIIDGGWREVAEIALAFVEKHAAK